LGDPSWPAPQIIPKLAPLCRGAHVHLIAHATIAPSPYQDSLRRDGGQARWELGTSLSVRFRKCQVAFLWDTRILGVVYRRGSRFDPSRAKVTGGDVTECRPGGVLYSIRFLGQIGIPTRRCHSTAEVGTLWAPRHGGTGASSRFEITLLTIGSGRDA
jgi:hypothetical protein